MDLTYSAAEEAFRAEARELARGQRPARRCRPATPRDGLRRSTWSGSSTLFEARWAVVSWPEAYGGRDASLWEWLIFEEEYYRAGAPQRVTQNGIFLLAPTLFEFGTPEQQDRILPRMAAARGPLVPGLVRARRRQRPGRHQEPRRARRGGGRLAADRPEDLDHARRLLHPPVRAVPHRPGEPSATAASPTSWSRSTPRA